MTSIGSDPDRRSGDIFLAPLHTRQTGPMILDSRGRLVWFRRLKADWTTDLQVQRYLGKPVLTWWQGPAYGSGVDVIMDSSYRRVAALHAANNDVTDLHEFQITPQGTALISAWTLTRANLTSVGGPADGLVLDSIIQELDIKTGRLLWQWDAAKHVPVSASPSGVYDFFHLNSIQQLPDGNLLISARDTWAVYKIDRITGRIIWTLGGKHASFKMGHGTRFEWQHDARLHGHEVSLFDDAAIPQEERQSSAKELRLDMHSMTASLVRKYTHSPPLLAGAGGSTQVLPNGNVFVGFGDQPNFSEYSPAGRQIFSGSLPLGVASYRAYRFHWHGQPLTRPSLALSSRPDGSVRAYASWNGATELAAWRLLGGKAPDRLAPVGRRTRWTGFETTIKLRRHPAYVRVQALDRSGKVLATSPAQAVPKPS